MSNLVNTQSPAYGAPYGLQAYLLPPALSDKVAIEGPWIPVAGIKNASLEIAGTLGGGSLSVQLVGTNDPQVAGANKYTVTVGGTITNGDTITATIKNPNLPNGTKAVPVAVVTADTTTTLATKLATAINADTSLQALGVSASSAAAVVTVSFSSTPAGGGAGGQPPAANFTEVTTAITGGGGTETATVAVDTSGTNLGAALTALGLTAIAAPFPLFIKARIAAMTGTNPAVTVALNAST